MLGAAYRFTAAALADAVFAVPILEPPLVRVGAAVWRWPGAGRFYRSVAGRYANRLRGSDRRFRPVRVAGASVIVDVTEFTASTLYFGNVPYEPETTRFIRESLGRGGVFVDVGANHGYFTLVAAALVGREGRVFSFEPNPPVFDQLLEHVRLNAFTDRVVGVQQALADAADPNGILFVSQCRENSGLSTLSPSQVHVAKGDLSHDRTVRVRIDTFDRWRASAGVEQIDLVKIDTERAEDRVVGGMAASLAAGCIDRVICETTTDSAAHRLLCDAGFVPEVLDTVGPLMNIAYVRRR
jgi:FkbM family methyltransferase